MTKNYATYFLCYVLFFSLVITPDFAIFGVNLPNFLPFLVLPLLIKQFERSALTYLSNYVVGFFFIVLCSIFLVDGPFLYFSERFNGGLQVAAGVILLLLLLMSLPGLLVDKNSLRLIDSFVFYTFIIVLLIAFAERLGIASGFLSNIREMLYTVSLYDGDDRDFGAYGFSRPLALMKEPAHLAWFLAIFGFYLYKVKKINLLGSVSLGAFGLYLTYSPVYACLFLVLAIDRIFYAQQKGIVLFIGTVSVLILLSILAPIVMYRYDAFLYGSDISTISRLVAPPVVAWNVFLDNPLFGIGLTAHTLAFDYVYDVFANYGDYRVFSVLSDEVISKRITNYFFESLIYLGALGAFLFYWLLRRFVNNVLGQDCGLWLINLMIFSLGMGGFVTVRFFVAVFLFVFISYRCKIED